MSIRTRLRLPPEQGHVSQTDLGRYLGITTAGVAMRRKRYPDDFPQPKGVGRPRYLISDIDYYDKHGTQPKGRPHFGKSK